MNELAKDLAESLKTGLLGMGITLLSLYVLSLILDLMKVIFYRAENKRKAEATTEEATVNPPSFKEEVENQDVEGDKEELIAVITAALAAYLKKPQEQVRIGLIRRIKPRTSAWGMESRLNPME